MYKISTNIEPFMKTQREKEGYTTSYAQIRVHHGTHADFPAHVGIEGKTRWDLSGEGIIRETEDDSMVVSEVVFFITGGEELNEETVDWLCNSSVKVVGTDYSKIGSLETHERLLENGIVIVENLTNLDELSGSRGHVYCFALLIEGCDDGAPVVVGFDPTEE